MDPNCHVRVKNNETGKYWKNSTLILFGREANDPTYLNHPRENPRRMISMDQRAKVHREVKEALRKVAAQSKRRYDQTHTEADYRRGDWVLLFDKIPPKKFGKTWVGPFIIEEIMAHSQSG